MTMNRKELLTRFIQEVWNEGNVEAAGRYLAPRYTVRHDPGDPWHGKVLDLTEYKERLRRALAPCPDQHFELKELFADSNAVVATWFWTATHTGELAGFPPSGRTLHMSGATVYDFDGDRITGHWQIIDRLGVFQQLRQTASAEPVAG